MPNQFILEICANSVQSAQFAAQGNAHRIELCSNLEQGGTTPSPGMILEANKLDIEVYVLIRPRIGDFVYSEYEYDTIKSDVIFCKENGCEGVVIGFLTKDGEIDEKRTNEIVKLAHPMEVTFHRAFDCVRDPVQALETIIATGSKRILTSGLVSKAINGKHTLKKLIQSANGRISIMAGSGVNYENVSVLYHLGIREFHASASKIVSVEVDAKTEVAEEFYIPYKETELEKVKLLLEQLQKLIDDE